MRDEEMAALDLARVLIDASRRANNPGGATVLASALLDLRRFLQDPGGCESRLGPDQVPCARKRGHRGICMRSKKGEPR